jgi:CRISPR-associated endonuclease/helicase Cas3
MSDSRVRQFSVTGYDGPTRLSLMHSLAALNREYEQSTTSAPTPVEEFPEGLAEVTSWIRGPKRPVLAPSSVATIDQVLSMVLRGKWMPLRLLGVTRKVVVVDEAHTYDAYMQTLLRRVLTWLAACGVPVILLSATLSGRLARSLADAYRAGLPHALTAGAPGGTLVPSYPGWLYVDGTTGTETAGPVPVTERAAQVGVALQEYPGNRATDPSGLATAILSLASPVASGQADGNLLIVCNTVREAVAVYDALEPLTVASATPMLLMHSRFPVSQRIEHVDRVNRLYGKSAREADPVTGNVARPTRSVLVATQVVEQSLDLDMDHLISDLAPLAMLIQRVGRVHRHPVKAPLTSNGASGGQAGVSAAGSGAAISGRPALYPVPAMTVLMPMTTAPDGSTVLADRDERPYDQILLQRTHAALTGHLAASGVIDVPGDVQALIDAVYGADFTTDVDSNGQVLTTATAAQSRVDVRQNTAHLAAIPAPHAVQNLTELTSPDDADTSLARHGHDDDHPHLGLRSRLVP